MCHSSILGALESLALKNPLKKPPKNQTNFNVTSWGHKKATTRSGLLSVSLDAVSWRATAMPARPWGV